MPKGQNAGKPGAVHNASHRQTGGTWRAISANFRFIAIILPALGAVLWDNLLQVSRIKKHNRSPTDSVASAAPELSPRRRWLFRAGAAVVLPLVLLGFCELALRLGGVGYPTSFFLPKQIAGRSVLVENDQFGLRFFPPALARSPSPLVMAADKQPGVRRVFILGESAALGDPEPAFGFGRYLEALLEKRYPKTRFEVVCTAMTAINSHAILPIARECARRQGDLWVIYMGNNEFVGPFGPATVFGPQVPPLSLVRFNLALKRTRLGQLLSRLQAGAPKQNAWGGMKMFLDHQVPPDDPRKQKVYQYFQANLEDILSAAHRAGAKVVLSTVVSNLKDCPPFASHLSDKLSQAQQEDWRTNFEAAVQAQAAGQFQKASSEFQAAAQLDSSYAELQFRWGQCLLALTNLDQARRHFELARDCDSLPFRADTRLNEIIARTAPNCPTQEVCFVDAASLLAAQSPAGIPGRETVYEHVHLNFEGNYRLARIVAEGVAKLLPESASESGSESWASFQECSGRLALTDWDRRRVYESLLRRLAEPPFVNQMDHAAQMDSLKQDLADVRSRLSSESLAQARVIYAEATGAMPDDFYLRADFAKLEEDAGNFPGALRQWRAARDLIPFVPGPHYYLGKVLAHEGQTADALQELNVALALRPDLPQALQEKGRLLAKAKRFDEALAVLERAAELDPANARLCVDRADALAEAGRRREALAQLQHAVQLQPAYAEARYLLGVELALRGDMREAAQEFLETIRLSPRYAPGHLNLGIALAKMDKLDQAQEQFEETLRLDPGNQKAAEYLEALRARHLHRN